MLFRRKKKPASVVYTTPSGQVYDLFTDMVSQPHLLIAGATGSGKSVLVNGLVTTLLYKSPASCQFILIDPKGNELCDYEYLPHTINYSYMIDDCITSLEIARDIMMKRFKTARADRVKEYKGSDIYVIIDEFAELIAQRKKQTIPLVQSLCQLGRAARVHVILCTQCPTRDIIPTIIKCNIDSRVALRTASAQDSRNILNMNGAETLPDPRAEHRAEGYYKHGCTIDRYNIPMYTDSERLVNYWTA
ncbi:MAG: DNA translocase FtsK [Ruminococcus sp.]|nr:DNA translocase FtsK [Ruminococcus sp.]MBR1752907.1 DNA translocase FtsK [Ruminococcus sp.]